MIQLKMNGSTMFSLTIIKLGYDIILKHPTQKLKLEGGEVQQENKIYIKSLTPTNMGFLYNFIFGILRLYVMVAIYGIV